MRASRQGCQRRRHVPRSHFENTNQRESPAQFSGCHPTFLCLQPITKPEASQPLAGGRARHERHHRNRTPPTRASQRRRHVPPSRRLAKPLAGGRARHERHHRNRTPPMRASRQGCQRRRHVPPSRRLAKPLARWLREPRDRHHRNHGTSFRASRQGCQHRPFAGSSPHANQRRIAICRITPAIAFPFHDHKPAMIASSIWRLPSLASACIHPIAKPEAL